MKNEKEMNFHLNYVVGATGGRPYEYSRINEIQP